MVFTRPSQLAIRALAHCARGKQGQRFRAQEIARDQNVPRPFLATVLQSLVRAGLLTSRKGPNGGFCLARSAEKIQLYDILEAVGSLRGLTRCAIGLEDCSGDKLCPMHKGWESIRQSVVDYLRGITVADLVDALERKQALTGLAEDALTMEQNPLGGPSHV